MEDRRLYLIRFMRGCAIAADKKELGVDLGQLMLNGDLMREAADEFEKAITPSSNEEKLGNLTEGSEEVWRWGI